MLKHIEIKNFKSFNEVKIDLNKFNVLIGSCTSGKSNFIEIFKFLKDIKINLEEGINKHGGNKYLRNINLNSEPLQLNITFKCDKKNIFPVGKKNIIGKVNEINYELEVSFNNNQNKIIKEIVRFNCEFYDKKTSNNISINRLIIKRKYNDIEVFLKNNEDKFGIEDLIPESLVDLENNLLKQRDILILNSPLSKIPIEWDLLFSNIQYYDFNPKYCKNINKYKDNNHLKETGENLVSILYQIYKNKENKEKFLNLVHDLLPQINEIEIDKINEDYLLLYILEEYSKNKIPSSFISDGTMNMLALITALYFENEKITLIEEPERNIHPTLLSRVVNMMEESCKNKQIIITTHNPEILKYTNNENIFFIKRDRNGFSNISKPIDNESLKPFIEEIGIEEVFIDNFMEME